MIQLSQNAKGAIILAVASVIGTVIAQRIANYLKRHPSVDRRVDVTFVVILSLLGFVVLGLIVYAQF
jgi:predicted PurR-regulated permease PerM